VRDLRLRTVEAEVAGWPCVAVQRRCSVERRCGVDHGEVAEGLGEVAYEPLVLDSYSSARRPRSLRKAEKSVWGWLKGAAGTVYALACHIGCELVKGVLHGLGDLAGKVGGYVVQGREEPASSMSDTSSESAARQSGRPCISASRSGRASAAVRARHRRFGSMAGAQIKSALTLAYSSVRVLPGWRHDRRRGTRHGDQPRRLGRTSPDRRSSTSRSTVPATRTPSPTGY
jgi:hypothetical protein